MKLYSAGKQAAWYHTQTIKKKNGKQNIYRDQLAS